MAQFSANLTFVGLGTLSQTIPAAGIYTITGSVTHSLLAQDVSQPAPPSSPPNAGFDPTSAVVATINLNGSPIYTGQAGATGFQKTVTCAVGDVIAVVLTSSATADTFGLNAVKTTVALSN